MTLLQLGNTGLSPSWKKKLLLLSRPMYVQGTDRWQKCKVLYPLRTWKQPLVFLHLSSNLSSIFFFIPLSKPTTCMALILCQVRAESSTLSLPNPEGSILSSDNGPPSLIIYYFPTDSMSGPHELLHLFLQALPALL